MSYSVLVWILRFSVFFLPVIIGGGFFGPNEWTRDYWRTWWSEYDINGNREVSYSELYLQLVGYSGNKGYTEKEAKEIFMFLNRNDDGVIDDKDFQ